MEVEAGVQECSNGVGCGKVKAEVIISACWCIQSTGQQQMRSLVGRWWMCPGHPGVWSAQWDIQGTWADRGMGLEFRQRAGKQMWSSMASVLIWTNIKRMNGVTMGEQGQWEEKGWNSSRRISHVSWCLSNFASGALKLLSRSLEKKRESQMPFLCENATGKSERTLRNITFKDTLQESRIRAENKCKGMVSTGLTVQL